MNIYINTDKDLIENGIRTASRCSIDFLRIKIEDAFKKSTYYSDSEIIEILNEGDIDITETIKSLPEMKKDLEEVKFDFENTTIKSGELLDGDELFVGYHTLSNGLSFLGFLSCGDWEEPIFYIIYYDGKTLRGYIPICGNLINRDKMSAFGK